MKQWLSVLSLALVAIEAGDQLLISQLHIGAGRGATCSHASAVTGLANYRLMTMISHPYIIQVYI